MTFHTNWRAIVSAVVALAILLAKSALPQVDRELDALQSPLTDLIIALLAAYAGLESTIARKHP